MIRQITVLVIVCLFSVGTLCWASSTAYAGQGNKPAKTEKADKPGKGPHGQSDGKADTSKSDGNKGGNSKGGNDGEVLVSAAITALAARDLAVKGGWTGYKPLPPGIAKNLARGKPLPPGIAKKTLPGGLLSSLPNHPGYTWYAVGTDLVLMNAAGVLSDVLNDVFK